MKTRELIHWYNHLRFLILLILAVRRNMMGILLSIQVCRESSVSMTVMGIWFKNFICSWQTNIFIAFINMILRISILPDSREITELRKLF